MISPSRIVIVALASLAVVACSGTKLDEAKAESAIADELNSAFASFGTTAEKVTCPKQPDDITVGDSFTCDATLTEVEGTMRVLVTVTSKDFNVEFETIDLLYDMRTVESTIADDQSAQAGADIAVDCGAERLRAIAGGDGFTCVASDPTGSTVTINVVTDGEGTINWSPVDE